MLIVKANQSDLESWASLSLNYFETKARQTYILSFFDRNKKVGSRYLTDIATCVGSIITKYKIDDGH